MKKNIFYHLAAISIIFFCAANEVLARGGGGGSGGGGGGGGGVGGGSGEGGGNSVVSFIYLFVFSFVFACAIIARRMRIKRAEETIKKAEEKDRIWDEQKIKEWVENIFYRFQKDWSDFNTESMKEYLTPEYCDRMVLELAALKSMNRKNLVNDPKVTSLVILEAADEADNSKDNFTAEIKASADDHLIDTAKNENIYIDNSSFIEYWTFVRDGNIWKLSLIKQSTENEAEKEFDIADFAKRNNFYYDPDFGWLMMPNKGAIFHNSNFMTSDINNHVIGRYQDKIVEFYTYIPVANNANSIGSTNYVVAQTILPIKYNDILVRKKNLLLNFSPAGLRKIETESNDFNKKFCLWADPKDQVSSFELLTPNFMERIYELPFELNIEVVDCFLYFYAKSREGVNYDKMLEIISWAFDEMKR